MFKTEDILAELAAGRTIEDIAKEATDALNAANTAYKKKKAEEEAAAKKLQEEKKNAAAKITDSFTGYLRKFHPALFSADEWDSFFRAFNPDALVNAIDETVSAINSLPDVEAALREAAGGPTKVTLTGEQAKEASDIIEKFLRENNLF